MSRYVYILLLIILCQCNNQINSKELDSIYASELKFVVHLEKLPSPDGTKILYCYAVKYPTSDYGHLRFHIQSPKSKFLPIPDYNSFSDTLDGFHFIGWSGDTIKTICIKANTVIPKELKPYQTKFVKLKNAIWQQDYYYVNAFGNDSHRYFDSIQINKDEITFIGKDTIGSEIETFSLSASKGEVTALLGDSIIRISKLTNLSTLYKKPVYTSPDVSLEGYMLHPKHHVDWVKLKASGIFVEIAL